MKHYPSIPRSTGQGFREFHAYVFDKLDGSNLRAEWTRKRGWHKYGTRERLFDKTDGDFGEAIEIFNDTLAADVETVAKNQRWDQLTVFMEFWGDQSFAGQHTKGDPKRLTIFDASPCKGDILGPKEFLDLFGPLGIPRVPNFLGRIHLTRGFVEEVRTGHGPCGITFEGVVGKAIEGNRLVMAKAKTQAWIDKVLARYGVDSGNKIVNS